MHVEPREGEEFEQLLRRFKTGMAKSGILREFKRKQRFRSAGELRRDKEKAAERRRRRSRKARPRTPGSGPRTGPGTGPRPGMGAPFGGPAREPVAAAAPSG